MKDAIKEKFVLLLLNDGCKVEGVLIRIDKEKLVILLEKGKFIDANGNEETFDRREIAKGDIKEIRLVDEKEKPKEIPQQQVTTEQPNLSIKDNKPNDFASPFNSIPLSIQQKYQKDHNKYESNGFFDTLTISNNKDNYKEIKTYNEKNKETFNLDDNYNDGGNKGGRWKYNNNRSGRGGNQRGGRNYGQNKNSGYGNNYQGGYNNQGGQNHYNNNKNNNNNNTNNSYYNQNNYSQSNHFGVKQDISVYSNDVNYGFKGGDNKKYNKNYYKESDLESSKNERSVYDKETYN